MSRPALSFLRTALSRPVRPSPRPLAFAGRASTRGKKSQPRPSAAIPTEAFFERFAQFLQLKKGNPNEYYRCVSEWLRAHKQKKTDDPNLLKRIKLPLETLYEAAIFLQIWRFNFPGDVPAGTTAGLHPFTLPMLRYASDQGHVASTITYLEITLRLETIGGPRAELPEVLRTRLDAIAATDRHPDALVVAARIAARDGNDDLAESLAFRAVDLKYRDDSLPLKWGGEAYVILGRIALRRNDPAAATKLFSIGAERFESLRARMELAYDGVCPEHVARLLTYAMREGGWDDCLVVSQGESDFAAKMLERGDKQRFMDHQYMAQEWLRLAKTTKEDLRDG